MRTNFKFALMSAAALLSLGLAYDKPYIMRSIIKSGL